MHKEFPLTECDDKIESLEQTTMWNRTEHWPGRKVVRREHLQLVASVCLCRFFFMESHYFCTAATRIFLFALTSAHYLYACCFTQVRAMRIPIKKKEKIILCTILHFTKETSCLSNNIYIVQFIQATPNRAFLKSKTNCWVCSQLFLSMVHQNFSSAALV